MTGAGRAGAAAAVLLALAPAAACSPPTLPMPPPAPVLGTWPGCEATGAFDGLSGETPVPDGGAVPADFAATAVVLCEDRSTDTVRAGLERTSTEVAPLLTYLARPSEVPSDGPCTADAWLPPWLFLVDADGRYVAPELPVDECGKPFGWYDDPPALPWLALPYVDRVVRPG